MPDGPPPEPVVQRLRVRYAKRGRLRFSSHRDFQRALERAVRRAGVPIAYSAGFSPHPRISYANAAPTGAASEAEYFELGLARAVDPEALRQALDAALPPGLDVLEVVPAGPGALADRLQASVWTIELPGVSRQELEAAVGEFLAADRIEVSRVTKTGPRLLDARAAVVRARVLPDPETPTAPHASTGPSAPSGTPAPTGPPDADGPARPDSGAGVAKGSLPGCAILQVVVRHSTPAVRPDDVLAALRSQARLAPPSPPRMTRQAQGLLDEDEASVADPLTADRDLAGA